MTINFGRFHSDAELPNGIDGTPSEQDTISRRGPFRNGGKRLLDIVLVLLAIPFILPLIVSMALAVARDGGSPFYSQLRVGKNGRIFRMWKMRTMVVDADARMAALLASDPMAKREWDETQKLRKDPRITPMGRFLRKSSMDEIPQLWNVLIGDMSIVGPRPMLVEQRALYPSLAYYKMRPGITGYWQTAGRNKTTFAARAMYDSAYEADISLMTDIKVLLRTVSVVLKGTGY